METTKQVSVFLENKPGRLAHVLLALAREKVNVVALCIMDSHEHSVLRLVTSDPAKTRDPSTPFANIVRCESQPWEQRQAE